MSIGKLQRDLIKVIETLLEPYKGKCWIQEPRHGHPRLYIEINGISRFSTMCKTPHQPNFFIQMKTRDVKQMIREITT